MEVSQKPSNVSIPLNRNEWSNAFFFLYVAIGMIFCLVWIGDTSFINDEPLLLSMALKANLQGDFFTLGLMGTKGLQYGPVPIWFYRFLLMLTHNIYILAFIKSFVVICANSLGIYYFFRLFPKWNSHTAMLIFSSPFLWFYTRGLWDNSLNITIILWGFVAYFYFIKTRHFRWFALTLIFLVMAFQVHLMSLPFIGAIALHMCLFCRSEFKKNWKKILILALCLSFFMKDYLFYLFTVPQLSSASHFTASLKSFFFPLYGGEFFSLLDFRYFVGKKWFAPIPDYFLSATGWIILLPLYGAFKSFRSCYKKIRQKSQFELEDHLSLVCLIWFGAFVSLSFLKNLRVDPHYFNSTWFLYFVLLNIGLNALWHRAWMRKLFFVHAITMFLAVSALIILLHYRHGTRSLHYGATLENQVEIATQLNQYGNSENWSSTADNPHWFPHAINLLRNLEPARHIIGQQKSDSLRVLYAGDNPYDGKILLVP